MTEHCERKPVFWMSSNHTVQCCCVHILASSKASSIPLIWFLTTTTCTQCMAACVEEEACVQLYYDKSRDSCACRRPPGSGISHTSYSHYAKKVKIEVPQHYWEDTCGSQPLSEIGVYMVGTTGNMCTKHAWVVPPYKTSSTSTKFLMSGNCGQTDDFDVLFRSHRVDGKGVKITDHCNSSTLACLLTCLREQCVLQHRKYEIEHIVATSFHNLDEFGRDDCSEHYTERCYYFSLPVSGFGFKTSLTVFETLWSHRLHISSKK